MNSRPLVCVLTAAIGLATLPACSDINDASEAYGQQAQNLNATGGTVWIFESADPENGIWPADIWAEADPSTRIPITRTTLANHLAPGDTVLLRGGYYRDTVANTDSVNLFYNIHGTAESPITIKSYPGETAIFDPGYPEFRSPGAWRPATTSDLATGEPHPEEWVSNATYGHCGAEDPRPGCCDTADGCTYPDCTGVGDRSGRLWGQMLDRQQRLMTYTSFGDMRADNESLVIAPLDDPRPGVGPLYFNPIKKVVHTYFGPGIRYNWDTGRIHIRMSHTHMNTPGIEDFKGSTNPNDHALSITEKNHRAAMVKSCSNVVIEDVVFQNGGAKTLDLRQNQNLTLSRVTIFTGGGGVSIAGSAAKKASVSIINSVLDGALAPWTTRFDVKNEYAYTIDAENKVLCEEMGGKWVQKDQFPLSCVKLTSAARGTNSALIAVPAPADLHVAHSELRNSHDGLILNAEGSLQFHHNLVENINDELVQVHGKPDVTDVLHIHENMFRQVLHPVSLKNNGVNAPVFFYRNVVDQRIPVRYTRFLSPDAPEPVVWANSDDFKMNDANGPLYVYHNTFLGARRGGSTQSTIFSNIAKHGNENQDRWFFNNIHMTFEREAPFINIAPSQQHRSDGNIWYSETYEAASEPPYIGTAVAGFEDSSQVVDPQLRSVSSESFEYGAPFDGGVYHYPKSDFRPAHGSPAIDGGVQLPQYLGHPLPDVFAGDSNPDVGALPADAAPLVVGVDGRYSFPEAGTPVADAGQHQTVVDVDRDGFKLVALDGTNSRDDILTYSWSVAGSSLYMPISQEVAIPLPAAGDQPIDELRLVFQIPADPNGGDAFLDAVSVTNADGDNLVVNPSFEQGLSGWIGTATGLTQSEVHDGGQAFAQLASSAYRYLVQSVPVTAGQTYRVSAMVRTRNRTRPVRFGVTRFANGGYRGVVWSRSIEGTTMAATGPQPDIFLPVGNHTVLLKVTDSDGNVDTDTVFVRFDTTPAATGNMLRDPSFEEHNYYSFMKKNNAWQFINREYGRERVAEIDYLTAFRGKKSAVLHGRSTHNKAKSIRQRSLPVEEGRTYIVSGKIKTDRIEGPNGKGASILVRRVTAAGGDGKELEKSQVYTGSTTEFETFKITCPIATDEQNKTVALNIWLNLDGYTAGSVWFDDIVMREVNRLEDGSFEQGGLGWYFRNGSQVLNRDAQDGLASLVLEGQQHYQFAQQRVDVTPGETLTVSGWVKTASLLGAAQVVLTAWDADGTYAGRQTLEAFTGTNDYTYFEHTVVVDDVANRDTPAEIAKLDLTLVIPGQETGTAYFDHLHIE